MNVPVSTVLSGLTPIMSCLLAVSFFLVIGVLVGASPTVSPALEADTVSREQAPSSGCPSCSLSQMKRNSSSLGGQSDMVEAVKRHILNMLHLSARPNLTQPVPRAALLNAIKKLHVGRVTEDGSVEIQEEGRGPGATPLPEPPSEIITFGEPGEWNQSESAELQLFNHSQRLIDPPTETVKRFQ